MRPLRPTETKWPPTNPGRFMAAGMGLSPESREAKQFRLGLRDLGYTEGRDVVLEWRSAKGDYHRVPELVADLIQSKVDVIVQDSTVGTEITKRATSTVPIVMALVLDPLGSGLVRALASPGGNVTGLSMMATELYPKRSSCTGRLRDHSTLPVFRQCDVHGHGCNENALTPHLSMGQLGDGCATIIGGIGAGTKSIAIPCNDKCRQSCNDNCPRCQVMGPLPSAS